METSNNFLINICQKLVWKLFYDPGEGNKVFHLADRVSMKQSDDVFQTFALIKYDLSKCLIITEGLKVQGL